MAFISGRIMGDECTDCYYWCEPCGVFTVRLHREAFAGPETTHDSEPIPREEGNRRLALIRLCPEPYSERCHCEGHRGYFGDWLD
jgi:hypothetical protein